MSGTIENKCINCESDLIIKGIIKQHPLSKRLPKKIVHCNNPDCILYEVTGTETDIEETQKAYITSLSQYLYKK